MLVVKIAVPYAEALLELANANSSLKRLQTILISFRNF